MSGGLLGEIFAALSFSGALVATLAYLMAARTSSEIPSKQGWQIMGNGAFLLHGISVFGIIATLFYLIYTHQYQYHYVWSHSSNELPVYYMISCFWEGQEGSFLLWTFWHVVLGFVVMARSREWRDVVMSVIAAVNLILASMVLGINLEANLAKVVFVLGLLLPAGYLGYRFWQRQDSFQKKGILHLAGIVVAVLAGYLAISEKGGQFSWKNDLLSMDHLGYTAMFFILVGLGVFLIVQMVMPRKGKAPLSAGELFAMMGILGLGFAALMSPFGDWKIGSTPFMLLRDAMPDAPVFASNPDFIPQNGTGLNPLLQNYWMVIHPPTLFLGFASAVVPFAFVVGGLITGKTTEWLRPATPWTIFSVMILGVGIIMGGYWAYETLNFGGYWNWDPVENSSLVPWLLGIASLHAMIAYRKSKAFLGMTMWLVISVFIFVLYSTFLTRSGVLGDTSVHTFTDLGLSGQLLILLFVFLFGIISLYVARLQQIPAGQKTIQTNSSEFLLFLGVLSLLALSIIITIATSIPVFNKVLGTAWATPLDGAFFYYRWTVWLAVAMALLSGLAQFVFWRKLERKRIRVALLRPYLAAVVVALVLIFAVMFGTDWEFAFEDRYQEWKELAELSGNPLQTVLRYLRLFFFMAADKFLLVAALFMVFANLDLMVRMFRKGGNTKRVTGGTIAHVGFGLMLIGMLYSAGYDQVISRNVNPAELSALPQDRRTDNVLLQKGRPRDILGYQVTYIGKKEAVAPISDMEVIQNDGASIKVRFKDVTGDVFAQVLPLDVFMDKQMVLDLVKVEKFLNDNIKFLKPLHINERSLYGLRFVPRVDAAGAEPVLQEEKAFVLYPEAEVNDEMGLVAHPARKIMLNADIYAHVSTIPKDEEPKFKYYTFEVKPGDTMTTTRAMIVFDKVISQESKGTEFDYILQAQLRVMTDWGKMFEMKPEFRIDAQNKISYKDDYCEEIYTSMVFSGVDPDRQVLTFQAQELQNPPDDIVVIQVLRKPWINFLWLGTFVVTAGFIVAMVRRVRESRKGKIEEVDA